MNAIHLIYSMHLRSAEIYVFIYIDICILWLRSGVFSVLSGSTQVTSTLRLIIQLYHREGMHALFAGKHCLVKIFDYSLYKPGIYCIVCILVSFEYIHVLLGNTNTPPVIVRVKDKLEKTCYIAAILQTAKVWVLLVIGQRKILFSKY